MVTDRTAASHNLSQRRLRQSGRDLYVRNHRARPPMPMAVSALKSNWGLENVGIPASYTRWKMAPRV